jgi:hypothetical protein
MAEKLREMIEDDLGMKLITIHEHPNADIPWKLDTVYKHLSEADIIILPANFRRQPCKSNNRLTQAMALGKPVICEPMPSYLPIVKNLENAIILKSGSDTEWRNALKLLRDNENLRVKLAKNALETSKSYTLDEISKQWVSALEVLSKSSNSKTDIDVIIPTKNNPIVKKNILFYFLMIPCILVLLVMRSRTAMLGLALLFIIFIFYYTSNVKSKMTYLFIAIIAIILSMETIYNVFFLNYDTSSVDSVTAGRTDVYMEALKVIDRYPLTGRLFTNIEITQNSISEQIHNYLLSIYFELGVFSFGFLIIYFSVLFYSAWRVFKYKLISNLLILLLFFVSLSEYTFPYAPGTTTFLPFFLLGYEILKPIRNE